jgi:hypothetical protein
MSEANGEDVVLDIESLGSTYTGHPQFRYII